MFFGYPIAAVAGNWLHDCLCEMVTAIHASIDAGQQPAAWPAIIPAAHRARLRSRTGLRDRLATYSAVAEALTSARRTQVLTCLAQQNAIADLVSGASDCERLTDLPAAIREPSKALFVFAFDLLTDLEVRDAHYAIIYNTIGSKVCPFCALEYFDAPGAPREDLDHYLAVSRYPFAAANLRNLTPMGMKCNERHKHDSDILRDEAGNRRRSFDPYVQREIRVSLIDSVPFGQADGQTPQWRLEFVPDSPECVTWDNVFHIRTRIERDVLNPSFRDWLGFFAAWFVKRKGIADVSNERIIASLRDYIEDSEITGLTARDFLRVPVFRMIEQHCSDGNGRLLQLMRDLVTQGVPQPPAAP
jgi:hypothetical protein